MLVSGVFNVDLQNLKPAFPVPTRLNKLDRLFSQCGFRLTRGVVVQCGRQCQGGRTGERAGCGQGQVDHAAGHGGQQARLGRHG